MRRFLTVLTSLLSLVAYIVEFDGSTDTVGDPIASSAESASTASDSFTEVTATFSSSPTLTAGTSYIIIFSTTGTTGAQSGNYYRWEYTNLTDSKITHKLVRRSSNTSVTGTYETSNLGSFSTKIVGSTCT